MDQCLSSFFTVVEENPSLILEYPTLPLQGSMRNILLLIFLVFMLFLYFRLKKASNRIAQALLIFFGVACISVPLYLLAVNKFNKTTLTITQNHFSINKGRLPWWGNYEKELIHIKLDSFSINYYNDDISTGSLFANFSDSSLVALNLGKYDSTTLNLQQLKDCLNNTIHPQP